MPLFLVHILLLCGFLAVTTVLLFITVVNASRVRRVAVAWRRKQRFGWPTWPLAFLSIVSALGIYALLVEPSLPAGLFLGYFAGGVLWLYAAIQADTVLVTDDGIVTNLNRRTRTLAWGQVVDYFTVQHPGVTDYIFFTKGEAGQPRRVEVSVPAAKAAAFRLVVTALVDARFTYPVRQKYGDKALEQ